MNVGIIQEIKSHESRVAQPPDGVDRLCRAGHTVFVQSGAGIESGYTDEEYRRAGAEVMPEAAEVWEEADLIVKVKEPQPSEWPFLRRGQVIFTYLHLAAERRLTEALLTAGVTGVAYETVCDARGGLPLLRPMSEVAGLLAPQEVAKYLERPHQGRGILLPGVAGVAPAEGVVLGGGVVGENAARQAAHMGAIVNIFEINMARLRYLRDTLPRNVITHYSTRMKIHELLARADFVIGAVLIPGAKAPRLIEKGDLARMKHGSVFVDVAIDQGGCAESSRPTTHASPTYVVDGVVHYCVTNMPGAVGRTSSQALAIATLPYVERIAAAGIDAAAKEDPGLAQGVNVRDGEIIHKGVAEAFRLDRSSAA